MNLVPKSALLAALLGSGAIFPAHAADTSAKTYTIAAAPLAEVLNRYAAESGVILVFDAGLLQGLQSKGLQGKYDVKAGFHALLAGTRYEAVLARSGAYILRERPAPQPPREPAALETRPDTGMGAITVLATTLPTVEKLDREMIVNMASINGDITSQLKLNPNVQYAEEALSSLTGGEITPAEISIHGAKPYQNELLLDGVSIVNDIDPGNKLTTTSQDVIPGGAQSLAVDSSILCDIEVKDSNISAEYGRFTGGVVSSRICSARKRFGGSVSMGYTSSGWSKLFIDPAQQEEFLDSSNSEYQPRFKKWTYKTTVEARPTDEWGVLISAVRKTSDIPLKRFDTANDNTTESKEVTQRRKQDTLIVKTDYTPANSPHKAELTAVYAPSANTYFVENYRDSDYTINGGGLNLSGRLESRYAAATLTQQLSYSQNEQSRRSDADYYRNWRWSTDKNWGDPSETNPTSGEGAWGDVDQNSKSMEYKFRSVFRPYALGATRHRVAAGVEIRRQHADYARLKDQYYYYTVTDMKTSGAYSNCLYSDGGIDTEACSETPTLTKGVGQYFKNLMRFHTGSFELDSHSSAAYVEDDASWGDFTLRAGLRADKDSMVSKTNVAPRLKLGWQAAEPLYLDVGANRYYGRNLFGFALQEKINTLKTTQSRSGNGMDWSAPVSAKAANRLEDMRSPFDDELTAGVTYEPEWLGGPLNLRFTRRNGRDQIVKVIRTGQSECLNNQCYIYTNNGGSVTRDFTVSWSNARAFKTGNVAHRMWVAFNKSDVNSNYDSYTDAYGSALLRDDLIRYDGKVMRYSEKPADNYNRPWTLRIGSMSTLASQQLTVSNILRLRAGYQQVLQNGTVDYQGSSIVNYERTDMPQAAAIDTVVHWNPRVYRDQRLDVKLTIENLTNRMNRISVGNTYATYERGRTFALEIGYAF